MSSYLFVAKSANIAPTANCENSNCTKDFFEVPRMTTDPPISTAKPEPKPTPDIESDADELFEDGEFVSLSDESEKENIRRDARRKIEIYWEKRRLREQLEDFDESEFDF